MISIIMIFGQDTKSTGNKKKDKWDSYKLKCFCLTKEMIIRGKRQSREWEKIFVNYTCDNESIKSRIL
jgi:hypothetical protein